MTRHFSTASTSTYICLSKKCLVSELSCQQNVCSVNWFVSETSSYRTQNAINHYHRGAQPWLKSWGTNLPQSLWLLRLCYHHYHLCTDCRCLRQFCQSIIDKCDEKSI